MSAFLLPSDYCWTNSGLNEALRALLASCHPLGTSSGQGQSTPRILPYGGCDFGRRGQTDTYVEAILTRILEVTVLGVGALSHCRHH